MPTPPLKIEFEEMGRDEIVEAFKKWPNEFKRSMESAGEESGAEIIGVTGLQAYPPETPANRPPAPYYQRGAGTVTKTKTYYTSENMGKKWVIDPQGLQTIVGNQASYSKWLHGLTRVAWAAAYGWLELFETAVDKIPIMAKIYGGWVDKTLRRIGLK